MRVVGAVGGLRAEGVCAHSGGLETFLKDWEGAARKEWWGQWVTTVRDRVGAVWAKSWWGWGRGGEGGGGLGAHWRPVNSSGSQTARA